MKHLSYIANAPRARTILDWSIDGRYLLYATLGADSEDRIERFVPALDQNGRELLYLNSTRKLMVMPVDIARGVLRTGSPQPLFDVPYENNYFATADGSRFLIRAPIDATVGSPPVEVLTDWSALVRTTGSL